MGIIDLYSRRKRQQEKAKNPQPLSHDQLPDKFRIQVLHILIDTIGKWMTDSFATHVDADAASDRVWATISRDLARAAGLICLGNPRAKPIDQCLQHFPKCETDDALDFIEYSFRMIDKTVRFYSDYDRAQCEVRQLADDAILELNQRFLEHNLGYAYESGRIIWLDSTYVHNEVMSPAFSLLQHHGFSGANDEFMRAHEHLRHGRYKESMVESLKAFESTMKTICQRRRWTYNQTDNASSLIKLMFDKELIPQYLQSQFSALKSVLESGVPTVRNKAAGHGQGAVPITVPDYLAAYAINLTASNILLLVKAHTA